VPETRAERIIFALGLCVAAGIAVLIVFARDGDSATSRPPAAAAPRVAVDESAAATTSSLAPKQKPTPRRRQAVSLRLTAARADSWVEVRSESASGKVLFVGIVTQGKTRSFNDSRLYVRFGNATAFDARLEGAPLRLRPGTYSALVTRRGLEDATRG